VELIKTTQVTFENYMLASKNCLFNILINFTFKIENQIPETRK